MDWQTPIAILVVALATGILVRHYWRMFTRKGTGCGSGCSGCPSRNGNSAGAPLVTLQGLAERRHTDSPDRPRA